MNDKCDGLLAIDILEKEALARPGDRELLYRLATAYRSRGLYAKASACFAKGIELGSRTAARYIDLGYAYCALGKYDRAVATFKEGLQFNPDDFSLLNELGTVCKALGAYEESAAWYARALKKDGTRINAYRDLAQVHCIQMNFTEAQSVLMRALAVKPDDRLCLSALADIKAMAGAGTDMPVTGISPATASSPAVSVPDNDATHHAIPVQETDDTGTIEDDLEKDAVLSRKLDCIYAGSVAKADTVRANRATARAEIARKTVCSAQPTNLTVYLNYGCNLQCIMCGSYRDASRQLPYEALQKIEPWLASVTKINWVGGEVFMVDYFRELLERIGAQYPHIQHVIMTNGLLIDPDWAQLLARLNTRLVYSIDAVVPETYESIRRGARFESLCDRLRMISQTYQQIHPGQFYSSAITALVMRRNMYELELFPDFCKQNRIGYLRFGYLNSFAVPQEDIFLRRNAEEIREVGDQVKAVAQRCAAAGIGFDCAFASLLPDEQALPRPAPSLQAVTHRCYFPWTNLYIDCDGTVKLNCTCKLPVGNVMRDGLEEIWNGPVIQRYRRGLMTGDRRQICARECIDGVEHNDLVNVWD